MSIDDGFKQRVAMLEQAMQGRRDLEGQLRELRAQLEALTRLVQEQQRLALDVVGTTGGKATIETTQAHTHGEA